MLTKATEIRNNLGLTKNDLYPVVPSIFKQTAFHTASSKYTQIPTNELLNILWKQGFAPVFACQSATKIAGKAAFTKHVVRLRARNELGSSKPETQEIVLVNSHDTSCALRLMSGIFRMVCSNGVIAGDFSNDHHIRHTGNIKDDIIEATYSIVEEAASINQHMDTMKSIDLTHPERLLLAEASNELKDGAKLDDPRGLLYIRRQQDTASDLWTTFNVIQENLTQGGVHTRNSAGNRARTKPIKAIDANLKINQLLWKLAVGMAELKQS